MRQATKYVSENANAATVAAVGEHLLKLASLWLDAENYKCICPTAERGFHCCSENSDFELRDTVMTRDMFDVHASTELNLFQMLVDSSFLQQQLWTDHIGMPVLLTSTHRSELHAAPGLRAFGARACAQLRRSGHAARTQHGVAVGNVHEQHCWHVCQHAAHRRGRQQGKSQARTREHCPLATHRVREVRPQSRLRRRPHAQHGDPGGRVASALARAGPALLEPRAQERGVGQRVVRERWPACGGARERDNGSDVQITQVAAGAGAGARRRPASVPSRRTRSCVCGWRNERGCYIPDKVCVRANALLFCQNK